MTDDWTLLESEAARKISEAMALLSRKRWDNATPAQRALAARKMVAGQRRKRSKGRGKKR